MMIDKEKMQAQWRVGLFLGMGLLAGLGLLARLWYLHVSQAQFLQEQGNARTVRTVEIDAFRGMITDRNGDPLAVSTPVQSIWVNPHEIQLQQPAWETIAQLLALDLKTIEARVKTHAHKNFVYLARQIPPQLARKIEALSTPGVYTQTEYRRYYPAGEVTAQVIGFTGVDHQGQEGIELAYNDWLREIPGKQQVIKDRAGHQIEDGVDLQKVQGGKDIALSLDKRIQYLAYRELLEAITQHRAKAGTLVALDIETGEVLALVNYPSYNPNLRHHQRSSGFRNRAVTDTIEPGSLMKAFSIAAVLESGLYTPSSLIDTYPGRMKIGEYWVRDVRNYGQIDVSTVIKKSSNVGISKLILSLPEHALNEMLWATGFGQTTASQFPGESAGVLRATPNDPFSLATLAFGYGMSATPLQVANGYATIAAGGVRRPVTFLKTPAGQIAGEQVMSSHVANALTQMMYMTTLKGGTATRAQVPGYHAAGKTGTVKKSKAGGYEKNKYLALFAGFAPVEKPKIAMVVVIDEPSAGKFYGGLVAAPVFSKVMQGALSTLRVPESPPLTPNPNEFFKNPEV